MTEMGSDLRQAARRLLEAPGFTLAAVAVLACGIGANVAIFSALDAIESCSNAISIFTE